MNIDDKSVLNVVAMFLRLRPSTCFIFACNHILKVLSGLKKCSIWKYGLWVLNTQLMAWKVALKRF